MNVFRYTLGNCMNPSCAVGFQLHPQCLYSLDLFLLTGLYRWWRVTVSGSSYNTLSNILVDQFCIHNLLGELIFFTPIVHFTAAFNLRVATDLEFISK